MIAWTLQPRSGLPGNCPRALGYCALTLEKQAAWRQGSKGEPFPTPYHTTLGTALSKEGRIGSIEGLRYTAPNRASFALAACLIVVISGLGISATSSVARLTAPVDTPGGGSGGAPSSRATYSLSSGQVDHMLPSKSSDFLPEGHPIASSAPANPVVNDTLVLTNDTVVPGNFLAGNAPDPTFEVYDPAKGEVFVSDVTSNFVFVINDTTGLIVRWVSVPGSPNGLAYDSERGEIFVAASDSGNVTVINDTNDSVVASIHVGGVPYELAHVGLMGEVIASNLVSDNLSVTNDTNDSVAATIPLGGASSVIAYVAAEFEVWVSVPEDDSIVLFAARTNAYLSHIFVSDQPASITYLDGVNEVCVAYYDESAVQVFSDTNTSQSTSIDVGMAPTAAAYDPSADAIIVANSDSRNLSIISAISDEVGSSVRVDGGPLDVVEDTGDGELFVVEDLSAVTEISDYNFSILRTLPTGSSPDSAAVDPGRGETFVTDPPEENVTVFSDLTSSVEATIPVLGYPSSIVYDAGKGEMFVSDTDGGNVTVLSDATNHAVKNISVGDSPGASTYDPAAGELYVPVGPLNEVKVVSDATLAVVGSIRVGSFPTSAAYDPRTDQVFVANLDSKNVSIVSTITETVSGTIPVSGYPADVTYDPAVDEVFVVESDTGNVSDISDTNDTVVDTITGLDAEYNNGAFPAIYYEPGTGEVVVTATPSDFVSFVSDLTNSLVAQVNVGQNPDGLAFDPQLGTTYVTNQGQGTVSILYQAIPPPTSLVNFTESGLPTGTGWSVTLGETLLSSSTNTTSGPEPNGSYPYTIEPVEGYMASPSTGTVNVSGEPENVAVSFSRAVVLGQYPVTFAESGLPIGTPWGATLNGSLLTSARPTITFTELNGTFPFQVSTVTGFSANPASGTVGVSGAAFSLTITFKAASTPPTNGTNPRSIAGLPPTEDYELIVVVVLAVLLGLVGMALLRRRRKAHPNAPSAGSGAAIPPAPPENTR
jgi:YVTN family beta-propeller protein